MRVGVAALLAAVALVGCQKSPGEQCLDSFRAGLKDPESGKVLSFENGTLRYTATNSYGARTQGKALCKESNNTWARDQQGELLLVLTEMEDAMDAFTACRSEGRSKEICAGDSFALRTVSTEGVDIDRLKTEVRRKLGFE